MALGTVTACISAGILVDKIFEPLMQSLQIAMRIFNPIVGAGKGSGMAVIFFAYRYTWGSAQLDLQKQCIY